MTPPKPLQTLLLLQLVAWGGLAGWWSLLLTPGERLHRLTTLAVKEAAATPPPQALLAQVDWLTAHREARLWGCTGLVSLAGLIGLSEGIRRRRRDAAGGFLLSHWAVSRGGLALVPSVVLAGLVLPWPLPGGLLAGSLAGLAGLLGYGFACGRPQVT